jgi:hypothetical protein
MAAGRSRSTASMHPLRVGGTLVFARTGGRASGLASLRAALVARGYRVGIPLRQERLVDSIDNHLARPILHLLPTGAGHRQFVSARWASWKMV